MAWYDDVVQNEAVERTPGTEVYEAAVVDDKALRHLANFLGVDVNIDDEGKAIAVPTNFKFDSNMHSQFIDYWMGEHKDTADIEKSRNDRYLVYKRMDEMMGEASLTLDTYADEALGIGFVTDPITIKIEGNDQIATMVRTILNRNGIKDSARSQIRNLCKFGDLGYVLTLPRDDTDITNLKVEVKKPDEWRAVIPKANKVPIAYKKFRVGASARSKKQIEKIYQPWEMVQSTLPDEDMKPYGRSILDPMRHIFDQLVTIEALLALSRASRVERLIIKVPVNQKNPVAAAHKLNTVKSVWKNTIFNEKLTGTRAYGKVPALTDMMFMPADNGFNIERLSSNIDISSTDDVEYFRDKALMMTGLPKGYFLADSTTDRGQALQQQDLKFARKLIPVQQAYTAGLVKLCMVLILYCGGDPKQFKVTVSIKRPIQISSQAIDSVNQIVRTTGDMIDSWKRANEDPETRMAPKVPENMFSDLLRQLGMEEDISKIFDMMDDETETDDDGIDKSGFFSSLFLSRPITETSENLIEREHMLFDTLTDLCITNRKMDGPATLKESEIFGSVSKKSQRGQRNDGRTRL